METKKRTKGKADERQRRSGGFTEFLKEKKTKDGKLNKLGEWLLAKGDTGLYVRKKDMKYVLR